MTAFLVVSVTVDSLDWVSSYVTSVPQIVRSHGGRFVAVSKIPPDAVKTMEGTTNTDGFAIIAFPSTSAIEAFLEDPAYASHRRARREGTKSEAWSFENWDDAPQFVGQ